MVTEECALVILSLQSTKEEHNQADSKSFSESKVKKVAWAEHTSLSHSINKSHSQSKSKNFSHLESKDLPHPDSKGQYLVEATSNAPQPENYLARPEKSPTHSGKKSISQTINKSLSLSEFGGDEDDEAVHTSMDQVY